MGDLKAGVGVTGWVTAATVFITPAPTHPVSAGPFPGTGKCLPAASAPPGPTPAPRAAWLHLQESARHRPLPLLPGMGGSGRQPGVQAWFSLEPAAPLPRPAPHPALPPLAVASEQAELRGGWLLLGLL